MSSEVKLEPFFKISPVFSRICPWSVGFTMRNVKKESSGVERERKSEVI